MFYQNWEKGEKVAGEVGEKVSLVINKLVLFKYIYTLILLCTFYFPMGESINAFISFLTDKTHKLSAKAIVVIGVVLSVLFIDNVFGFTFYYQNEKKLSQIEQINRILSNEGDNEAKYRHYLLKLKEDIVQRKSLQDKTFDFLTSLDFSTINNQSEIAQESVKVSTFWHFISSSWVFVF
ncbi:hypothetical protein Q4E40_09940 [Pontibacter sp. BT731]|uniref:hypothetical protein n=1 Tax=Pontibacter coccineus TaxID=3063328 RepID=UPI0026E3F278|nr:hypothetical protein [Pontibacter sp. BT731]MDO6390446.1 hypothetical protein [Pontibacter sp. BT731]